MSSIPRQVGPYTIEAEIGRGGMGVVYRARDAKLGRTVATKVLPEEVANDPVRVDRFRQEARTLAALNHPNILTIHDVDSDGDMVYVVTELLEGETLRKTLSTSQLDWRRAVDLAAAFADGLAAAHDRGVVHRDLKPENLFVTNDGVSKILDFGLARVEPDEETDATVTRATSPGIVMGTVGYMAPEQVRGEKADARSDIFSFGCVLYEMLTGRSAFKRKTSAESISAILREQPLPPRESVANLPGEIDRVLSRCLEKKPQDRFQSARDLAFSLRAPLSESSGRGPSDEPRVSSYGTPVSSGGRDASRHPGASKRWLPGVVVLGILSVVAITWVGWFNGRETATSFAPTNQALESIAVLPFANESDDAAMDFLGDGLADNVINRLAKLPNLRVVPRGSSFRHRGRDSELEAVAEDLDVQGIVTGRVSRRGDRLVIGVELTDVRKTSQLWGERYDTSVNDILVVESEIAERITGALRIQLSGEQAARLTARHTDVPAAHLAFLEARHAWSQRSETSLRRSLELYDRAIMADPGFALAHAGKAETYVLMMFYLGRTADYEAALQAEVDAAIRLDPNLPQAYPVQGYLLMMKQDWAGAERALRRAIELDPEYATGQHWYGVYLFAIGDYEGSLKQLKLARRLDPGSLVIVADYAVVLRFIGRVDEALEILLEVSVTSPSFWRADANLGELYLSVGRHAEAIRWSESAVRKAGEIAYLDGLLALAYGRGGNKDRAHEELERMKQRATTGFVTQIGFARAYLGLNDMDRCLEWLERAAAEKDPRFMVGMWRYFPKFIEDSRWTEIERRMGYPDFD